MKLKLCVLKFIWENINRKKQLFISFIINCTILCWFFLRTQGENTFLGFDKFSLCLIYAIIWCILMSFTLVNDVILETNKSGIIEQIFLSSCNMRRYVFLNVMLKHFFSVLFISAIFLFQILY